MGSQEFPAVVRNAYALASETPVFDLSARLMPQAREHASVLYQD